MSKLPTVFLFSALILILPISNTYSQDHSAISNGIRDIYSFRIIEAESFFNSFIKSNPNDPRGYYFLASLYLWKYLGNSKADDFEKFIDLADRSIAKCDKLIAEENTLADALYFRGSMYGYKSIAYNKAEKYLEMIWASKNCTSDLNDALKINPGYYDAYLGLGLFKFALSQVPSTFKWALNMIGFEGDLNQGLNYIRLAATKGKWAKVEAQYYLAQILTDYFQSYKESDALLKELSLKYPGNLLFQYSLAVTNMKKRELKTAEKTLKNIISKKNVNFDQIQSFSYFLLGDINFFRNNAETAIQFYNRFLLSTTSKEYTGIATYRMALCFEFMGDTVVADGYYDKIRKSNWSNEEDLYAFRKSVAFNRSRPSEDELNVIKYQNLLETEQYKVIADSLKDKYESLKDGYVKGIASLTLSDALYNLGKFEESLNYAILATQFNTSEERWIVPFGNYYAAKAIFKLGNKIKSYEFLEKAESAKDYDFINKLRPMLINFRNKFNEG
ncbi:MAG: DUF3808 domain-containing protein [Ignavibacteriaceae bacterium]|nr:DUF3808 domain-containing protein [Ignavibacteriaceae bacterium]